MLKTLLLLPLLILGTSLAQATTVYKYVDENGNTVFTDVPRKGAKPMDVEPVPTIPAFHAVPQATTPSAKPPAKDFHYNKVIIMKPEDQKYFINDGNPISVQIALSPSLRPTDQVQLMVNGSPKGQPKTSTVFSLDSAVRGTYKISANVQDQNGKVIGSSNTVTVYVKRHSVLIPRAGKSTP